MEKGQSSYRTYALIIYLLGSTKSSPRADNLVPNPKRLHYSYHHAYRKQSKLRQMENNCMKQQKQLLASPRLTRFTTPDVRRWFGGVQPDYFGWYNNSEGTGAVEIVSMRTHSLYSDKLQLTVCSTMQKCHFLTSNAYFRLDLCVCWTYVRDCFRYNPFRFTR